MGVFNETALIVHLLLIFVNYTMILNSFFDILYVQIADKTKLFSQSKVFELKNMLKYITEVYLRCHSDYSARLSQMLMHKSN